MRLNIMRFVCTDKVVIENARCNEIKIKTSTPTTYHFLPRFYD